MQDSAAVSTLGEDVHYDISIMQIALSYPGFSFWDRKTWEVWLVFWVGEKEGDRFDYGQVWDFMFKAV